jgi:hypothetical protein
MTPAGDRNQHPRLWLALAAVLVLAVAATALWIGRGDLSHGSSGADGGPVADLPRTLRALCLVANAIGVPEVVDLPRARTAADATEGCSVDGILKLLVTTPAPEPRFLVVIGMTEAGEVRYYSPGPGEDQISTVPGGAADQPIGPGIRLKVSHTPGALRLYGLFSRRPLSMMDVEKALADGFARDRQPPDRLGLPPAVEQDSFWLRVGPSTKAADR